MERNSKNKIVFGDCRNMSELADHSVHLVVTSPPYFNAPFDYPSLFQSYDEFKTLIHDVGRELKRVLDAGRVACFVCDDTLIDGKKYPVVSDVTKILIDEGFKYRDKIIWVKPEGYIRISRRSGVLLQHPFPMYYYPDNLQESILIFQNGDFNYDSISQEKKEESRVDLGETQKGKWYLSVWSITNVLPNNNRLEKGIAAFPDEIPYRLIKLFSYKGETVLDPFMGSGTTLKVASGLGRKYVGYDIDVELLDIVKEKLSVGEQTKLFHPDQDTGYEIIIRDDVKHLRKELQRRVGGEPLDIHAKILARVEGIKYTPFLCRKLKIYDLKDFDRAMSKEATFMLRTSEENQLAISWWVSAKRTRTYPYARVYDSLKFTGKKVTIIPVYKDEGAGGDRDYIQWDTISLMSLLNVYFILGYYRDASSNPRYPDKITSQRYDTEYLVGEIKKLLSYHSSALHWNKEQVENGRQIGEKAIESYLRISKELGVKMHSLEEARRRIEEIMQYSEVFRAKSRELAEKAQRRESITEQPKERLEGEKSRITIENTQGGKYFFTVDEAEIHENDLFLIEAKHTELKSLPSLNDIKDGLLRMALFTNLKDVNVKETKYNPVPVLKLTTHTELGLDSLPKKDTMLIEELKKESMTNGFKILLNGKYLD